MRKMTRKANSNREKVSHSRRRERPSKGKEPLPENYKGPIEMSMVSRAEAGSQFRGTAKINVVRAKKTREKKTNSEFSMGGSKETNALICATSWLGAHEKAATVKGERTTKRGMPRGRPCIRLREKKQKKKSNTLRPIIRKIAAEPVRL